MTFYHPCPEQVPQARGITGVSKLIMIELVDSPEITTTVAVRAPDVENACAIATVLGTAVT